MTTRTFLLLLAALIAMPAHTAQAAPERKLAKDGSSRLQVCHSMIGFRDTLVFHVFKDQQAVLQIRIENTGTSFPASATVYLFAPETSGEAIDKWVNNQHSDGLFADAPEPVSVSKLPAGTCMVSDPKVLGEEKQPTDDTAYVHHRVKLMVKAHHVEGSYQLEALADEADVYVKKN